MSTTVELGQIQLSYPISQQQLTATARFVGVFSDDNDADSSKPSIGNVDWFVSRLPWICRGRGLRLALKISVDGQPLDDRSIDLIRRVLQNADASIKAGNCYALLTSGVAMASAATSGHCCISTHGSGHYYKCPQQHRH